jgi:alpha-glucosidase
MFEKLRRAECPLASEPPERHYAKQEPTMSNPVAVSRQIVTCGTARFTVLSDRLIRMEWATDSHFEDRATLAVCNRVTDAAPFTVEKHGKAYRIDTGPLQLEYQADGEPFHPGNLTVRFAHGSETRSWYPGMADTANLGGTLRTLDQFDGPRKGVWNKETRSIDRWDEPEHPPGLLSRDGWAVVDDSTSVVLEADGNSRPWVTARPEGTRQDLYLLAYGLDFKAALADAATIFGRQPLMPRYALGYWYSRYWAYTDTELEELVNQFDRYDVPLDVLVIDMDWHLLGWTGTTWDPDYFPDPKATLSWLHERGIQTSLNLHPAEGVGQQEATFDAFKAALGEEKVAELRAKFELSDIFKEYYLKLFAESEADYDYVPFDITDPAYMDAYFTILHRPLEADGVDIWWMDWQQGESTALPGLDTLPWINHLHWEDRS